MNFMANYGSKLTKNNKIVIDAQPDFNNIGIWNDQNNMLGKNKVKRKIKQNIVKPQNAKTKLGNKSTIQAKSVTTIKSAKKVIKNIAKKSPVKNVKKPKTLLKKKTENKGELIFLSESREEEETKAKKNKCIKGTLREIVIDGNNIAMA
jgi:hypothetical protein